jgi:hypothetical protein
MIIAGCTTRTEALCLPGHPRLVPEDAARTAGISTAASFLRTAFPTSDFHRVSFKLMSSFVWCCILTDNSRNRLPESSIAPYLTRLQKRVKEEGVRVGSYPLLMKGVYVSLIGQNENRIRELGKEVEENVQGKVVTEQEIREAKGMSK